MTGSWCAGQEGQTPLDVATRRGHGAVVALLEEVRALVGPVSNLCLQLQLLSARDSPLANTALRTLGRALSWYSTF